MSTRPGPSFWQHISALGGCAAPEPVAALMEQLSAAGPAAAIEFAEDLAAALYAIDTRAGMSQPIRDTADDPKFGALPLSEQAFLAARCGVVLAGQQRWDSVVADPSAMAGAWDLGAEDLLQVAPAAFAHATGSDWTHRTAVDCATGSNPDGWR